MSREFVCQKFCFGYQNRRWKVGTKITVEDSEIKNIPKHFVPVEQFKQPDLDVAGGPRNDGVLKKIVKITDTGMSPETRAMLNGEMVKAEKVIEPEPVADNVPAPVRRGRRLGSKNK